MTVLHVTERAIQISKVMVTHDEPFKLFIT